MGEAADKVKKALRGDEDEDTLSEEGEKAQPNVTDPGEGAGGPEQAANETAAAEEVD
jgi:hypothetical protein